MCSSFSVGCLRRSLLFLASFVFLVLSAVFSVSRKVGNDSLIPFNPILGSETLLALGLFLLWVGLGVFLGETMRKMFERK